jgi:hypothetical protein
VTKRNLTRLALTLPAVAVVGLLAAACNSSDQGSPAPATQAGLSGSANPSTSDNGGGTPKVNPCELLTGQELSQLGLQASEPDHVTDVVQCAWKKSGSYSVSFNVYEKLGLSDLNPNGDAVTKKTVGSHDAEQYSDAAACTVALGLSKSTAMTVLINGVGDQSTLCQEANDFATLVEPKLPAEQN